MSFLGKLRSVGTFTKELLTLFAFSLVGYDPDRKKRKKKHDGRPDDNR